MDGDSPKNSMSSFGAKKLGFGLSIVSNMTCDDEGAILVGLRPMLVLFGNFHLDSIR